MTNKIYVIDLQLLNKMQCRFNNAFVDVFLYKEDVDFTHKYTSLFFYFAIVNTNTTEEEQHFYLNNVNVKNEELFKYRERVLSTFTLRVSFTFDKVLKSYSLKKQYPDTDREIILPTLKLKKLLDLLLLCVDSKLEDITKDNFIENIHSEYDSEDFENSSENDMNNEHNNIYYNNHNNS